MNALIFLIGSLAMFCLGVGFALMAPEFRADPEWETDEAYAAWLEHLGRSPYLDN